MNDVDVEDSDIENVDLDLLEFTNSSDNSG